MRAPRNPDLEEPSPLAEASESGRIIPIKPAPATLPAEGSRDEIHCHDYHGHATRFHSQLRGAWVCTACGPRPGDR